MKDGDILYLLFARKFDRLKNPYFCDVVNGIWILKLVYKNWHNFAQDLSSFQQVCTILFPKWDPSFVKVGYVLTHVYDVLCGAWPGLWCDHFCSHWERQSQGAEPYITNVMTYATEGNFPSMRRVSARRQVQISFLEFGCLLISSNPECTRHNSHSDRYAVCSVFLCKANGGVQYSVWGSISCILRNIFDLGLTVLNENKFKAMIFHWDL